MYAEFLSREMKMFWNYIVVAAQSCKNTETTEMHIVKG